MDRRLGETYLAYDKTSEKFVVIGKVKGLPGDKRIERSVEVLKNCQVGEPVFLTKNGRGRFVVMDIEDYERDKAEKKLLEKLQEAEAAVKDGEGWLSLDELKTMVGE